MKELNNGDFIKIVLKDEILEGRVMPSNEKVLFLKLESGYNIGIERNKIVNATILRKNSNKLNNKEEKQPARAAISILHTGGTIASKVDYSTGAVIAKFSPSEILSMFPELKKFGKIRSKLISNLMSENIRFEHYNMIAKTVKEELEHSEGIIITHGTDTLHYTSAALSFILRGLKKPVVLVGSQRSSDRGSSDAFLNLNSAARFIQEKIPGVFICMHSSTNDDSAVILKGVNAKKLHSSRRDAFKPVNCKPVAMVKLINNEQIIEWISKPQINNAKLQKEKLKLELINPNLKIGILRVHPSLYSEEVLAFKNFDGLIIEGTGLGHLPILEFDKDTKEHSKILRELEKLAKKIPVYMSTQTIFGRVNMQVYSPGRKQQEIGVLGNYSTMNCETAFVKLAWVLSNYKKEDVERIMNQNIEGEQLEILND